MLECGICFDEITYQNIVYYYINNNKTQSKFCCDCTEYMIENHFQKYINDIANADCEKSLFSALANPIPLNLTVDTYKKSQQIDLIEFPTKQISGKLKKNITDIELEELNKDLQLLLPMLSDESFDYIGVIKQILTKYKLNNVSKN
jgi:hypothetical protein